MEKFKQSKKSSGWMDVISQLVNAFSPLKQRNKLVEFQSGVTIAGTRYMYLSSTDRVVRAKKGTNGVHAIKTQQSKNLLKSRVCSKLG